MLKHLQKIRAVDAPKIAERKSLDEQLEFLNNQIAKAKVNLAEFTVISEDVDKKKAISDKLDIEITGKEIKLSALQDQITSGEKMLFVITDELSDAKTEKVKLISDLESLKTRYEHSSLEVNLLEEKKKELISIEDQIEIANQDLNVTLSEIAFNKDIEVTVKQEILKLNSLIDAKRKEMSKIIEEIDIKFKKLSGKEGELSEKETWLQDKEKRLLKMKSELELYYNRKFPYLII